MASVTDRIIGIGDIIHNPLVVIEEPRTKPTVGILDAPLRCLVVNEEWMKHVGGAIEVLTEWRAWVDDTDERSDSVQEILKMLAEGYCMFQLRQNPSNPCLMEQSLDNGVTWTTAFDHSLCMSPALASESLNDSIDLLNQLLIDYDGTVASIAPDMVYDGSADDNIRDEALCHALNELVDLMCEAELEYRLQVAQAATITAIMLALLAVVILIATAGTATPFYLALSASLAGGFGVLFGGLSEAILTDETAKDAVVCCMRDALYGATITKTDFENSLSSCGFTGGTNEAQLAGAISQLLTQSDMYTSFLDYMQRAYRLAELGIADCPCVDVWEYNIDFTIDDGVADGWSVVFGDGWFSGSGYRSETIGGQELNYLYNYMPLDGDVTYIEFTLGNSGTPVNFQNQAGGYIVGWTWKDGAGTEWLRYASQNTPINTTVVVYDDAPIAIDQLGMLNNPWNASKWYIKGCTVKGTGINPYV